MYTAIAKLVERGTLTSEGRLQLLHIRAYDFQVRFQMSISEFCFHMLAFGFKIFFCGLQVRMIVKTKRVIEANGIC